MRWSEAAGIGIIMGCLFGLVLWAAIDSLSLASFILYKNTLLLPGVTALITISIAFLFLFSYPFWATKLEQMIVHTVTKEKEDEDE
jgi:Mg/Co/Ni transporter MgtE